MKKSLVCTSALVTLAFGGATQTHAAHVKTQAVHAGWHTYKGNPYYLEKDHRKKTGFVKIKGKLYWFNQDGHMETGWRKINGHLYFFNKKGVAQTGWQTYKGKKYWLNQNFQAETGFRTINGNLYWFNPDGHMETGWRTIAGHAYHFDKNGVADQGWRELAGQKYWFNENYYAETGFRTINGNLYWFNPDGHMETGWRTIAGHAYHFSPNGIADRGWRQLDGHTYWFNEHNYAETGYRKIDGKLYWFNTEGQLAPAPQHEASDPHMITASEKVIINSAYTVSSPGANLCAAWVSQVFSSVGQPYMSGNACDMYYNYCTSSNIADLRPGMLVAVPSHSHNAAGRTYGHVAIYIGNGQVRENIGSVRTTPLKQWMDYYGTTYPVKWGWANHIALD